MSRTFVAGDVAGTTSTLSELLTSDTGARSFCGSNFMSAYKDGLTVIAVSITHNSV